MMMLIEDHYLTIKPKDQRSSWRMGAKDHGLGGHGPKPQKRGGSGGGPKNRQILHTGGEIWGGVFLGGSRNKGS